MQMFLVKKKTMKKKSKSKKKENKRKKIKNRKNNYKISGFFTRCESPVLQILWISPNL